MARPSPRRRRCRTKARRTAPREDRAAPPAAAATSGRLLVHVDAVACRGDGERPMARPHTADAECDEVRCLHRPRDRAGFTVVARRCGAVGLGAGAQSRRAAPAKPRAGDPSGAFDSRDPRRSGPDRPFRCGRPLTGSIYVDSRPTRRAHPRRRQVRRDDTGAHPRSQHRLPRRPARADGSPAVDGEYAGLGGGGDPA